MATPSQVRQTPSLPLNTTSLLIDPINRVYRLRFARFICHKIKNSPITPNEVTVVHAGVGVFAALLIYQEHYLMAVFAYELRTILDCLDGLLAREKKLVSGTGRALDAIADGITFNALMFVGAVRLIQDFRSYNSFLIVVGVFLFALVTAHSGNVYQLMKRKLGSIIKKDIDLVELEWREHYDGLKKGNPPFLSRFGFWLDSAVIRFVSKEWYAKVLKRRDSADWKTKAISEAEILNELACITRKKEFKRAVKAAAFVSDSNIFAVLSFCFFALSVFPHSIFPHVHPVLVAFVAGFIYSVFSLTLGLYFLQRFIHGVHKE